MTDSILHVKATAAQLLDRACQMEKEGKIKTAAMALEIALKRDAEELALGKCSLSRAA